RWDTNRICTLRLWRKRRAVLVVALICAVRYLSISVAALWEGTPMAKTLAQQIQDVLKTLALAEAQAVRVQATMRAQHIFWSLDTEYLEDDIAHVANKARYMKLLADHRDGVRRH